MKAYVGIGSNIGDQINNCLKAISMINSTDGCSVVKRSSFYRTEPVGYKDQAWFVNCVILLKTGFSPDKLFFRLQEIEKVMGRKKKIRWGPRLIDLDIIMYDDLVMDNGNLSIPHPLMHKRRFVLVPMNEIAPEVIHPVLNKSIREILDGLSEDGQAVFLIRDKK